MNVLAQQYRAFIAWSVARPRQAVLCLVLAMIPALYLTGQFFAHIHAGLDELLPPHAASVKALRHISERMGSQAHLTIIATSPSKDTNRAFIDRIGQRLRDLKLPEARSVQSDVKTERAWAERRASLLLKTPDFDRLMGEIDTAIASAKSAANPLFVQLGDKQTPEQIWTQLRAMLDKETRSNDRYPAGYLETPDGTMVVALVWLGGSQTEMGPSERLMAAVKREEEFLRRTEFASAPQLRIAYAGDVPNLIEEHDAILADLSLSSLLVVVLVSVLIVFYFRSKRSVLVVFAGIVPGLIMTFALGRLVIGHLNSNTAFLGSIIAGNGINYPLLFLAYYRLRPDSEDMTTAIYRAAVAALPGTLGAAATASAAYGGLAASDFRGFSQFGWLGGLGMLTTWVMCFLTVPVAIAIWKPRRGADNETRVQNRIAAFFSHSRLPRLATAAFVLVSLGVAAFGVWRGTKTGLYEMHLMALRNRESLRSGSASWDHKLSELFGSWVNPVVVMAEKSADREAVATELRRVLISGPTLLVDRIDTIDSVLPPAAEQERRITRLRTLRAELDRLDATEMTPDARALVDKHLNPQNMIPITQAEIPSLLVQGYREISGEMGRSILLYPTLKIDYEDGENMQLLARALESARLPEGTVVGGAFLFMTDVIALVRDQALSVVLGVCFLVGLALVPIFGRRVSRIALVLGTVVPVALVAQAMMLAVDVRINMLNFAAVPITIGVGADYVINLLGAMAVLKVNARQACVRMGGAILLCSTTTIVGYASLLVAQSGALRTFGWSAVLGEVLATGTVLLVLPTLLAARPVTNPTPDSAVDVPVAS